MLKVPRLRSPFVPRYATGPSLSICTDVVQATISVPKSPEPSPSIRAKDGSRIWRLCWKRMRHRTSSRSRCRLRQRGGGSLPTITGACPIFAGAGKREAVPYRRCTRGNSHNVLGVDTLLGRARRKQAWSKWLGQFFGSIPREFTVTRTFGKTHEGRMGIHTCTLREAARRMKHASRN